MIEPNPPNAFSSEAPVQSCSILWLPLDAGEFGLEDCVIVIVDFVSFRYRRPLCSLFLYSLSSPSLSSLFLF